MNTSVVALPDGSVDRYCHALDGRDSRIDSREAFSDRIANSNVESLRLSPVETRPGGQSVNLSRQSHELGSDVTLFGHLDHPVFDTLPFETHSMGPPADVHVLSFAHDEFMLSAPSRSITEWTFADVRATDADVERAFSAADVVCVVNWIEFPCLSALADELARLGRDGMTLLFDPGDVTGSSPDAVTTLRADVRRLADVCEVVVSADESELAHLASCLDCESERRGVRERELRRTLGASSVVLHEVDEALAATSSNTWRVENFDAETITRRTGAGDRFDAGLLVGLDAGLGWRRALALGNTCASYYVEHGEEGDGADLRAYIERRCDR